MSDFEEKKDWKKDAPPINWLGAYLIAKEILDYTKSGIDDDDSDSAAAKMNRMNFIARSQVIMQVLNVFGPTLEAAQAIQADGQGFFTDLSVEILTQQLEEGVAKLKSGCIWKFRAIEMGLLDFSNVPGEIPTKGNCKCDDCNDGCDDGPPADESAG